tara:strand:- start:235 stop:444 length:210 start_codon:yes stop_codon:yes gene_type:complete
LVLVVIPIPQNVNLSFESCATNIKGHTPTISGGPDINYSVKSSESDWLETWPAAVVFGQNFLPGQPKSC